MSFFRYTFFMLALAFFQNTAWAQFTEAEIRIQELFLKGMQARILDKNDQAEEIFKEVLSKDPSNGVVAFELARALEKQNKDDEAIKYAKKAVELEIDNTFYYELLGDLYQKTNRNADGAALYQKLIVTQPHEEQFYLKQAFFFVKANDPKAALLVYENLEKQIGINEELTRRKHALYLGQGDFKNAANELEKLVAAYPTNKTYRHLLADFFLQVNEKSRAEKVYKEILTLDPDDAAAKLALVSNIEKSGDDFQFLASLKPLFQNEKISLDAKVKELIPIIQKVADNGDVPLSNEALNLCAILEQVHPRQAKVASLTGDLYFYTNRKEEARKQYARTLELDDSVYLVWEQLLLTQKDLGDAKSMIETSEKAMDVFPNQGQIYFLNGYAYGLNGEFENALKSLQQAQLMSARNLPLQLDVLARQGWTYLQSKNLDKAESILTTANQKGSQMHPETLEYLGDLFSERGKTKDAIDYWEKALKYYRTAQPDLQKKIESKKPN